jgi:hypothetical protein
MERLVHDILMGRAADARRVTLQLKEIITVATKVQATAGDGTLRCGAQAVTVWVQTLRCSSFEEPGAS